MYAIINIFIMQRGAQNGEDYFEVMDRQQLVEAASFTPIKSYSTSAIRERKNQQHLVWKIKAIDPSTHRKPHYKFSRNISFQDEERMSSAEDDRQEDESTLSSLAAYYRSSDLLYRKTYDFGTNWVGRREYFASTFFSPETLLKGNSQYYQKDSEEGGSEFGFDSSFESGNLLAAYRVGGNEYDLVLQNDSNTKGNTQWFYFRVSNPPKNVSLRINIVNMRKADSLFNYGMLPCLHSRRDNRWVRAGRDVSYSRNHHQIENSRRYYYTLSFTVSTQHDHDVLRIAYSYPYTYSDLQAYLHTTAAIKYKKELCLRETLLTTLGKNSIEVLTIREPNHRSKPRPLIIVIARQHPGETPGSFICQGLLDFLLAKDKQAEFLRKNYEIKVIPMVNPDGVCAGNYRTNLYGFDLNRRWDGSKVKNLHEAASIKRYIGQASKGREIAFILDLHGHSRKMYSFFYGNPSSASPIDVRIFPLLCSKLNNEFIKFEDCTFASEEYKRNTARVQFGLSFGCLNIFTFEASFFGYKGKDKMKKHYTIEDYKQLGATLGRAVYIHERGKELSDPSPENKDLWLYRKCLNELRNNMILLSLGEKANSGSQSSPEECQLKENQSACLQGNEDYSRNAMTAARSVKISRKAVVKRQFAKVQQKSQRQMQVMDIAQVNSMLPNNILALFPSSFMARMKEMTQPKPTPTASVPKMYDSCKLQLNRPESSQLESRSTLIKSSVLGRSGSEQMERRELVSEGMSRMAEKRSRQLRSSSSKATHVKVSSYSSRRGSPTKESSPAGSSSSMSEAQAKSRFEKEMVILELKTINANHYSKVKQGNFIGKNSAMPMLETLRIKKKQA